MNLFYQLISIFFIFNSPLLHASEALSIKIYNHYTIPLNMRGSHLLGGYSEPFRVTVQPNEAIQYQSIDNELIRISLSSRTEVRNSSRTHSSEIEVSSHAHKVSRTSQRAWGQIPLKISSLIANIPLALLEREIICSFDAFDYFGDSPPNNIYLRILPDGIFGAMKVELLISEGNEQQVWIRLP